MAIHPANTAHEVAYQDLVNLLRKHEGKISALEMLAVAANLVGKLAAMQDQRTVTSDMALEVVARNIKIGNRQAQDAVANAPIAGHA